MASSRALRGCVASAAAAILMSCSEVPPPSNPPPAGRRGSAPSGAASARPLPASSAPNAPSAPSTSNPLRPPPPPEPDPAAQFEVVLDADTLGAGEGGFSMARIEEGLLVVRSIPAAAFLVTREGAKPLPDLFKGLRSPVAEWAPLDFSVHGVRGSLVDMAFTMDASASGEVREVRGRPGRSLRCRC